MVSKPPHIFDRDWEWEALTTFATAPHPEVSFGVVSGRRRQGKTFLLRSLTEALGGFYFEATEGTDVEVLRLFGMALARHTGSPVGYPFADWRDAFTFFFSLPKDRPMPLVIDEFPYLMKANPAIPSLLKQEIDLRGRTHGGTSNARVLICGSALSVMGKVLSGQAPLRGRARLELVIQSLPYREAADFWGVTDPRLAAMLHAVVGGTPAYRDEFVAGDIPASADDFDAWVARTVLNRRTSLFREGRYLLTEEADIRDPALYHSVLSAVAEGNNNWGGIAGHIGHKSSDIAHPLNVLEDCGLLVKEKDAFRSGRTRYRIAEPLITFYQAIMRPEWTDLSLGLAEEVWARSRQRFLSKVVGPHFEMLCREHALRYGRTHFGEGGIGEVVAGTIADPANRSQIDVDIVVLGVNHSAQPRPVKSLGEAKWDKVMDLRHLERLRRARDLLSAKGYDTANTVLACYSGAGFHDTLRAAADDDPSILLVDLPMLYGR
ncbi:ATPase [Sphaerisporangium siamense]|uniref:AAA+ ATPase superfamily predicted ATPase n=1 Tax=Sphaerisporangium siamense TaxID=795645 RepID=A0A7W7GCC0_9ACTN|nr:ATP-binding protein [Sphaerisporangium siamense]MBB4705893.1 AAA+ ATPase superfamily predicted ATPase [Sphaerisporangium siamense]GII82713.1 ATPase [Sphaerisporangium siamense]